jgi:hypothetical protein
MVIHQLKPATPCAIAVDIISEAQCDCCASVKLSVLAPVSPAMRVSG